MNSIFVVTAYRYGDTEKHSYVVGAYTTKEKAEQAKNSEESYRGGKYECGIAELVIDKMHKEWDDDEIY
jgi:hypothetical protein